jgi:hypothetical protein
MADFIYIMVLIAFFGLAAAFVKACDAIIGPDEVALAERAAGTPEPEPVDTERAA